MNSSGQEFLATAIERMKYYKDLAEKTFEQLKEDEFFYQPGEESNSIAIIIQHMAGNMLSRWTGFLTEDGEKEWRRRDDEFEKQEYTKQQLIDLWDKGWKCFLDEMGSLTPDDLLKTIHIRRETQTAMNAINRQLAHYPYHIGQIIYIGRMIRGRDWKNLSIPKGGSTSYNTFKGMEHPAKNN